VQAKRGQPSPDDSARVHEAAKLGIGGGSGTLPHLETIQRSFGRHDVTGVVAHTGAQATAGAQAMGAAAFTMGNHVAFAGTADLRTAAHEAAHVVQQRAGVQLAGGVGQVGDRYERHADTVADRVVRGDIAEDLLGIPGASQAASSDRSFAIQRLPIDVSYNTGRLKSTTQILATKDVHWYRSLPPAAFDIILNALNALLVTSPRDTADIAAIGQRIGIARMLNPDIGLRWTSDDRVEAFVLGNNAAVAHAEFADYDEDGRYWLMFVETDEQYRRQKIGVTLLQAGVERYGAIYASSATQQMHEDSDENDTRYLTEEGAALVTAAIAKGIMRPEWWVNPFFGEDEDDDNDDDY
jgi:hypothetical protein